MAQPPATYAGWPSSLVEIAEVTSPDAALKLVAAFGGTAVYVPVALRADSALVACIGMAAATALAAHYGGDRRLEIPLMSAVRSRKGAIAAASGRNRDIALRFGCTERWVRAVRNAGRAAEGQLDLFDTLPPKA